MSKLGRLERLGYASYDQYLASTHWRETRARYQAAPDLPQACICGETEVDLHHKTYVRLGEERLTDLVPLCRRCHHMVHLLVRRGEMTLDLNGFESPQRALAYSQDQQERQVRQQQEDDDQALNEKIERYLMWQPARAEFERWLVTWLHSRGATKDLIATDVAAIGRRLDAIGHHVLVDRDPQRALAQFRRFTAKMQQAHPPLQRAA